MKKKSSYQSPYTVTSTIVNLVAQVSEAVGRLSAQTDADKALRLWRINRIRTIRSSLAIERNTLSEKQMTEIWMVNGLLPRLARFRKCAMLSRPMITSNSGN